MLYKILFSETQSFELSGPRVQLLAVWHSTVLVMGKVWTGCVYQALEDAMPMMGSAHVLQTLHGRLDRGVPSAEFPFLVVHLACNWACSPSIPSPFNQGWIFFVPKQPNNCKVYSACLAQDASLDDVWFCILLPCSTCCVCNLK